MSQRVVTSFVNTNIPGAYADVNVKSNPVGLAASGNIVIIGEADGGDSYQNVALKNTFYTPDQADKAEKDFIAGPIVDAVRGIAAASADADITSSANRIYVVKTNAGTKASALVDATYGTLSDKNWGKLGNQTKFQVTSIFAEAAPSVSGNTIATFGAPLNGLTFGIRINGAAIASVTLSNTAANHQDLPTLIAEISALLPSGISVAAGAATNSLELTVAADNAAYRKGWGKALELVDSVPGDLAALGLAPGLTASAQEPGVEVALSNAARGLSETIDVNADIALQIGYLGTTATMTISQTAKTLVTTTTGGTGAALNIDLTQYRTIADLATFISAQAGYSASVSPAAQQLAPTALDEVAAIGIAASVAGNKPGRIKRAAANFASALATSRIADFAPTAKAGLPSPGAATFLANGARGATLAADIVAAIDKLAGIQVNIVVPLFSRDASADIADGDTDSSSTYTIDAIHAAVKSHCLQYSTPKLKRNRLCINSFWGSYSDAKAKSQTLGNFRCAMTMQQVSQVDSAGNVQTFMPWFAACVAAGMQAGGFYKAIVNKAANVISFVDPAGYDSGSPGDVEDALDAGLLVLASDTSRNYWVSDQTTYGYDANFVYNSLQAVYLSDILVLDLADSFQKAFVGKSLADVDASTALAFLAQKMDGYKKLKMIASSDDAPLGFKNAKVSISAPEMDVAVEVKLATAIYFIPLSVNISQVQQNAAA